MSRNTTTRSLVTAGAALAVVLAVVALRFAQKRVQLEQRMAAALERRTKLRADLEKSLQLATTAAKEARPKVAMSATAANAVPAPAVSPSALPPRSRPRGLLEIAHENPQLWNDFVRSKRAEVSRNYLPLFQRLNLTPAQRERFVTIFAESIARGADIGAAANAQELSYDDPAIKALRDESERRRVQELTELLGSLNFHEYDAFERALPVRGFVDGLAEQLAATAPLLPHQADALERALAEANPMFREGKSADPKQTEWESIDRRAREILTSAQFSIWQRGTAHNPQGGSRRHQALQAAYDRAVKRMREELAAVPR